MKKRRGSVKKNPTEGDGRKKGQMNDWDQSTNAHICDGPAGKKKETGKGEIKTKYK